VDVGECCKAEIFTGSAHPLRGIFVVIGANGYLLLGILFAIDAYIKFPMLGDLQWRLIFESHFVFGKSEMVVVFPSI
jgi:hypothetical protein